MQYTWREAQIHFFDIPNDSLEYEKRLEALRNAISGSS